jgi:acetyl-CoA carboxylase biotin carboxylase subunit
MEDAARRATEALRYRGAGTFEFLLDEEGRFYFIEMNTRLQVEHPVTELITGIDLAQAQLRIAAGEGLPATGRAELRGHAIELRINAEDPARDFLPAPGTVTRFRPPLGPGVRVDTHVFDGYAIPPFYDSLIGKVLVWAEDRPAAIRRARRALTEFELEGVPTTRELAIDILESEPFTSGNYTTAFIAETGPTLRSLAGEAE